MKNTLCLLVVLALIAQICAIPADRDEKDVKGDADQAAGVKEKDEAKKGATGATKKATGDANGAADNATGAAADLKNKGEHGPAKHGGNDSHKPGTHRGPMSNVVKGTEEMGKKIADASVKTVTDFMKIFGL